MQKEKKEPMVCSTCGKRIVKGRPIYYINGLCYTCCSPICLLDAATNFRTRESTGYVENEED